MTSYEVITHGEVLGPVRLYTPSVVEIYVNMQKQSGKSGLTITWEGDGQENWEKKQISTQEW